MLKVPKWQVCNRLATFQERGERYIWFLHKESIKVVYKLMLLFLSGIARHAQSTQNTKLALSLTCLKKEWRDEVVFFHEDKHWTFVQAEKHPKYKFSKSFQYLKKGVRNKVDFLCRQVDTILLDPGMPKVHKMKTSEWWSWVFVCIFFLWILAQHTQGTQISLQYPCV